MTPAFGFSVGDFISAINLIRKITKSLKETGGASAKYQDAVIELKGLKHTLQQLEALEPTEDNLSHVNAIRGMALACQLPLREFMTRLEHYETSLGPWADRTSFWGAGHKAKWAIAFGEEVEKLRALVAAKQISITLLLATHASQTLSSMNVHSRQRHGYLMSKIIDNRATLHRVQGIVESIEDKMEDIGATSNARIGAVAVKIDQIKGSIFSLRYVGEQIKAFIGTFPQEIRDLLHTIMQADWRTYQAVLQIQERLARSPTSYQETNIRFTDALGEYRELPYEFFCHWEPFEGFLRSHFKDKPGESKILDGHFHILDVDNQRSIVRKDVWNRCISQGAQLTMSMIMSNLRSEPGRCPRPDCPDLSESSETCHLKLFPDFSSLGDLFNKVSVSEEAIARQQVEEDLRIYGNRPEPSDLVEIDEEERLASLPPKRSASEFSAAIDRPAKSRKISESKEFNHGALTAMDWNGGSSPLDAWLNQSAIPSAAPKLSDHSPDFAHEKHIAQETEEIKVFRNIHIRTAPEPIRPTSMTEELPSHLELSAQIYYRNIKDRYPLLPNYLAHRLALANFNRAERLRNRPFETAPPSKLEGEKTQKASQTQVPPTLKCNSTTTFEQSAVKTSSAQPIAGYHPEVSRKPTINIPCAICRTKLLRCGTERLCERCIETGKEARCVDAKPKTRGRPRRREEDVLREEAPDGEPLLTEALLKSSVRKMTIPSDTPSSSFWTSRSPANRSSSVHSKSSSMNSSLHGSPAYDPEEQDPTFCTRDRSSSFGDGSMSRGPRGLPLPPVEFIEKPSFVCDICGQTIRVDRRSKWQRHVMEDVRPYMCIVKGCKQSEKVYASKAAWYDHEVIQHSEIFGGELKTYSTNEENPSIKCLFCGEYILNIFDLHVGRHMEEIAFAVVTKPYEDWDFYSDSSSHISDKADELHSKSGTTPAAEHNGVIQGRIQDDRTSIQMSSLVSENRLFVVPRSFECEFPGCTAEPFQTLYSLKSHANEHTQPRPYYCPVAGCSRSEYGNGFRWKKEMIRHHLKHESSGFMCLFCCGKYRRFTRFGALQRHIRTKHANEDVNDPIIEQVLAQKRGLDDRGQSSRIGL